MQDVLVLGAGKSATILIETLLNDAGVYDWSVHVADVQVELAKKKLAGHPRGAAYGINLEHEEQLDRLVAMADVVVSMLPPPMHLKVARKCLQHRKHFLNASYLSADIQSLDKAASAAGLSFICEMGLDPGIDHMSAMEMIHGIVREGGQIRMFRSHCGGLVAPESDNNPWHYKISWNPRNIVLAGKDGATYLRDGEMVNVNYADLFDPARTVNVPGMGPYAWYPNRDSMPYIHKYGLEGVQEFVRTTLRHPSFARGWREIVLLGLTDEAGKKDTSGMSIREYFSSLTSTRTRSPELDEQFSFLGLDSDEKINLGLAAPADVLQWILERKLALGDDDKDMIIMLHEIGYIPQGGGPLKNMQASLVVKGEDQLHTAMAKTVGLPLALAVRNILNGKIMRRGVFIPIYEDVYLSVLRDLEKEGIRFTLTA